MGVVTALGAGLEETWTRAAAGESGVRNIETFDARRYSAGQAATVAGAWPADRGLAFLEVAADELLRRGAPPSDCALVLGSTLGGMELGTRFVRAGLAGHGEGLEFYLAQQQARWLASRLGIDGPVRVVCDACASGASAMALARRIIRAGRCRAAIAGGYDPFCEFVHAGFCALGVVTRAVCRPFDPRRDGMVLGEGAGLVLLETEPSEGAVELAGAGLTADAFHLTRPEPTGEMASEAIRLALEEAGEPPSAVGYVNAHGTGTVANDRMEAAAIRRAVGEGATISSTKPAIGHTLGGAGAIEAILTAEMIRRGVLLPTLGHKSLDPVCHGLDVVAGGARETRVRVAVSTSFGFGGQNAALVLRKA